MMSTTTTPNAARLRECLRRNGWDFRVCVMPLLYLIRLEAGQRIVLWRLANGQPKITEGEFQATVFGMIVVTDSESHIDRIAGQERRLLQTLGHVPAQSVEGDL